MRIEPVHDGDLVKVSGRIFIDDEGRTFIRPRLNPAEPDLSEEQQRALDNTESKIRVFNAATLLDYKERTSVWVSLTGTFHKGSIDAVAINLSPQFDGDSWSSHPSINESGSTAETRWMITQEREKHLRDLLEAAQSNADQWRIQSFGLAGTADGGFSTSLGVLWTTQELAAWAKQINEDDLLVRPFIRAA